MSLWERLIDEIKRDMSSGSKELALKAIDHTKRLIQEHDIEGVQRYLNVLKSVRSGFVVLENIALLIEKGIHSRDLDEAVNFLDSLKDTILSAQSKINLNFSDTTRHCKRFLTISKSSTVLNAFEYVCKTRDDLEFFVLESQPLGEGNITARELREKGCHSLLIPDASSSHFVEFVDCIVVGADAIVLKGFYNKIGTLSLALLANFYNKPFYVLSDTLKVSRKEFLEIETIDVNVQGDIKIRVPLLELTPHKFVTKYITERGVVSFEKLYRFY